MPIVTTQIKVYLLFLFVTFLAVLSSSLLNAADREKENRIATQSLQTLFVGEPIWLKHNKVEESGEFLGLLTTSSVAQFSIIMVHGTGQGPDTSYLIGPLREILSEKKCNTLSIQMPVLSDKAVYKDYLREFPAARNRIEAAITYLLSTQPNIPIIIVAHSMGSSMMMDWASQSGAANVHALVAIGLGAINEEHLLSMTFSPDKINVPVLDLFGEEDYEAVLWSAPIRRKNITSTNKKSKQMTVMKADHFFNNMEEDTADIIWSWLGALN